MFLLLKAPFCGSAESAREDEEKKENNVELLGSDSLILQYLQFWTEFLKKIYTQMLEYILLYNFY